MAMSDFLHPTATSQATTTNEKRQLQDLSLNDAEALQAFVAKRKWFEIKLKELEAHEPIYPFVQVNLNSKQHGEAVAVQAEGGLEYRLPSAERVMQWQVERDVVEQEVIAFDGGDMERMKQKTRTVTSIPLTTPSTELVEVTLDLIVVVDRLLTLLRRRSELLELTKLRLHWDELRLSASRELDGMKVESDLIVARKCEWLSTGSKSAWNHPNPPANDTTQSCASPSPNEPRPVDVAPSTPRQRILSLPDTPSPSRRSPGSTSHATPKRASLRIPLLRSQITNLRIRHTTFCTIVLPRVGALLDRMIDIAGPLKGLGGVNGPIHDGQEGDSAVPGELLDAQDDLEAQVTSMGEHVQWYQQLEAQCTSAEQIHSSLVESGQAASNLADRLANVADLGPDNLRRLQAEWEGVSASLAPAIDRSQFTSSPNTHAEQNIEHEAQVLHILETARDTAQTYLKTGKEILDWLNRLSEQLTMVHRCSSDLVSRETEVGNLLDRISSHNIPADSSIDSSTRSIDGALVADLEEWHTRVSQAGEERPDLFQRSTIAALKYRAILKSPPSAPPDPAIIRHQTALTRLDDLHESTISKTTELLKARTRLLRDKEVDRLASGLHNAYLPSQSGLAAIHSELDDRIDMASCKVQQRNESVMVEDVDARLSTLHASISVDLIEALRKLEILAEGDLRYAELLSISRNNVTLAQMALQVASRHRELLGLMMAQTRTVDTIHDEAETFLARFKSTDLETPEFTNLQREITAWLDGIAKRVPFLSAVPSEIPPPGQFTRLSAVASTERSRPNPALSTLAANIAARVESTDLVVREALNSLTARVSSSLDEALRRSTEETEPRNDVPTIGHDQQVSASRHSSASQLSLPSETPTTKPGSDSTVSEQESDEPNRTGSAVQETRGSQSQSWTGELSHVDVHPASSSRATTPRNFNVQRPKVDDLLDQKAESSRPRHTSHSGVSRQSSQTTGTPAQRASLSSTPSSTPAAVKSASMSRPRYSSRSVLPAKTSAQHSSLLSPQLPAPNLHQIKSASLGRAAGNLYTSRRAPSIPHELSQYPTSSHSDSLGSSHTQREDRILARSASMRSISLGRSTSSTPSARRNISASTPSNSSQPRFSASRSKISSPLRSVRKYVPDPANKLDVAVGDIVNGFKIHVPTVPIGMTARDEYKDMIGSYWIGAEGRAKLCFCRILRSRTVMVRVGGGWVELSKFLFDHFGASAIEQSLSSLSLNEQMEETPTDITTPIRPRVSSASGIAKTPDHAGGSPQKSGETSGSPLTPLRFIKRASDSPDVRQKEKASLRIGRRSILGKE